MSYFMRSIFASLHMLIISQITVVGDMVDRCAGSRSWRYQGQLGDRFDGTLDCWTIVCSIGWNVLHEVFSYTWVGLLYMKFSPTRQLDCSICGFLLHVGGIFVSLCFFI